MSLARPRSSLLAAAIALPALVSTSAGAKAARAPAPSAPPAKATLHVTPGALGTPWTFEVTNDDTTPLRFVADGRLLSLEVTPVDDGGDTDAKKPKKRGGPIRCALPADVRPTNDSDAVTVLDSSTTYVEEFDPRLYCFDAHDAAALTPGSRVVAHLGWTAGKTATKTPPFIVDESDVGEDRHGVKELVAEAVTTPERLEGAVAPEPHHRLSLSVPERVDADTPRNLEMTVSVENHSDRDVRLMLRPETLAFEVASTRGVFECVSKRYPGTPIAEVFTDIASHGSATTHVLLAALCPDGALRNEGLYTVRTRIDTRKASGTSIGIESFDGVVLASEPTLVRVRHSSTALGPITPFAWASGHGSQGGHGGGPPTIRPGVTKRPHR